MVIQNPAGVRKGRLTLKKTAVIAAALLLAAGGGLAFVFFRQPLRSVLSLRKADDFPLYVMRYYGDYGFDEFLREGLRKDANAAALPMSQDRWACTTFAALGDGGDSRVGRNFDWNHRQSLLLFTDPPDGYASVSMVDISLVDVGTKDPSWRERLNLLNAPFVPMDGMNEYGVVMSNMTVPYADGGEDPHKVTIGSLHAIRLVLDHARNVDEALALLQNYNIDFTGGPPVHYLIADPAGNSVVVEYPGGGPEIIRNAEPWQVATNLPLYGKTTGEAVLSDLRFRRAYEALRDARGLFTAEETMALLMKVSQFNTVWSVDYDLTTGGIRLAMGRKMDHVLSFQLEMKTAK